MKNKGKACENQAEERQEWRIKITTETNDKRIINECEGRERRDKGVKE